MEGLNKQLDRLLQEADTVAESGAQAEVQEETYATLSSILLCLNKEIKDRYTARDKVLKLLIIAENARVRKAD